MRRVPALALAAVLIGLTTAGCSESGSASPAPSSVAAEIPTDAYNSADDDCALVSPTQIKQIAGDMGYAIQGDLRGCKIVIGESIVEVASFLLSELSPDATSASASRPAPRPDQGAVPELGAGAIYSSWGSSVRFTSGDRYVSILLQLEGSPTLDPDHTGVIQKDLDAAVLLGKTVIARTQG